MLDKRFATILAGVVARASGELEAALLAKAWNAFRLPNPDSHAKRGGGALPQAPS